MNGEKASAVRQRLREWYEEAEAKKGHHRRSLEVSSCFAPFNVGFKSTAQKPGTNRFSIGRHNYWQ